MAVMLSETTPSKEEDHRPNSDLILNALAEPVFVVDAANRFYYCNPAAEHLFATSMPALTGRKIDEVLPPDSPVIGLIQMARCEDHTISEFELTIETPRIGPYTVSVDAAPIRECAGYVAVSFREYSIARRIGHQLNHRGAARSVAAMAALLAHEVKNPLSGIRGAAQLLEQNADAEDKALTDLICEETDRIVVLVDRMDLFSDRRPIKRDAVNIHEVLEHVRRLAQSGFACDILISESYDPSLPPVYGDRDLLVQALLNLVKNAAEAVPRTDGQIILSTRFRQGLRISLPSGKSRVDLPLVVSVEDNGPGIPEMLRTHLFDPFVTSKKDGTGLGLALVAMVIDAHGGIIDLESEPRRTRFSLFLPMVPHAKERDINRAEGGT